MEGSTIFVSVISKLNISFMLSKERININIPPRDFGAS